MKTLLLLFCSAASLLALTRYDTLSNDAWFQLRMTGQGPSYGGDMRSVCDTTGYMYFFGGCSYGNGAGGSHNSDVYKIDLLTGATVRLYNTANPQFHGACQKGQTFDKTRNVIWICGGECNGPEPGAGSTATLWKFQCPDGPLTDMGKNRPFSGGDYIHYDPVNDKLYAFNGATLGIFDCKSETWTTKTAPFKPFSASSIPCCVDTKRGLFVVTLGAASSAGQTVNILMDVCFFDGATGLWSRKTPPVNPGFYRRELTYDEVNDRYLYFGQGSDGCSSELWHYEYDANLWTKIDARGRVYNDADKAGSTWPSCRHLHAWAYSPKFNVHVNWGGGQWVTNTACTDAGEGVSIPLWIYRLSRTPIPSPVDLGPRTASRMELSIRPNPFSAGTALDCLFPGTGTARLSVYDARGRQVRLLSGRVQSEEGMRVQWDGLDNQGRALSAGTYVIEYRSDDFRMTRPVLFLR